MTEVIAGRLGFVALGGRALKWDGASRLGFRDIAAAEFRGGRYEVCHYQPRALGGAFGPLSLDQTLWFACELGTRLRDPAAKVIVEYGPKERENAATLLGAFLVLSEGWNAQRVSQKLRDESRLVFPCNWLGRDEAAPLMRVRDCWEGVEMASNFGWITKNMVDDKIAASLAATKFWRTTMEYDGAWISPDIFVMADPATVIADPNPLTAFALVADEAPTAAEEAPDLDMQTPTSRSVQSVIPAVHLDSQTPASCRARSQRSMTQASRVHTTKSCGTPSAGVRLDVLSVHSVCKDYGHARETSGVGEILWSKAPPVLKFFEMQGITVMVRANRGSEPGLRELGGTYGAEQLVARGVLHADIPLDDTNGAVPSTTSIKEFLDVVRSMGFDDGSTEPSKAVAIHCKSGFGRSAMLACALIIQKYNVPGRVLLGWCRIARPGAIITPQQEKFLCGLRGREDLLRNCSGDCGGACCTLQ